VEEPTLEKARRKENIQNLYAFELFCQKRFDESLQLFARLQTGTLRRRLMETNDKFYSLQSFIYLQTIFRLAMTSDET
jgi:hypothetical protein